MAETHTCSGSRAHRKASLSSAGAGAAHLGIRSNAIETTISATVVIPVALLLLLRGPLAEPLGLLSQRLELCQLTVELGAVGGPAPVELRARDAMERKVELVSCPEALARSLRHTLHV